MKLVACVVLVCVCALLSAGCMSSEQNRTTPSTENAPPSLAPTSSVPTPSASTAKSATGALTQPKMSLRMTAIDVGRGDALLLTYPNGQHVLVDAGGSYTARTYVIPYLIQNGIRHLDSIVCTHEHWDHIDGLIEVLKDGRFTVDAAYDSGFPIVLALQKANSHERASIKAYLTQLTDRHVKREIVQAGDTIDVGRDSASQHDAVTFVVSPNAALTASLQKSVKDARGTSNHAAINENSLVLRIGYGQVHFLLAGDTSLPGSRYADASMFADPVQSKHLSADVLKLGHHGFSAPDDAFYKVVQPRYVVMTFGPQLRTSNPYCEGLHQGTQNFNYFKGKLWSTCDKGTVIVTSDGTSKGIRVYTETSNVPRGCCCTCVNDHPPRAGVPADVAT